MTKVFLTGASGKLGSNLYNLLKRDFNVLPVGNKSKIGFIQKLNLLNNSILIKKLNNFNPDVIVHLAALSNVDLCERFPKETNRTNYLLAKKLCEISKILK